MPDLNALEVLVADARGAIVAADIAVAGATTAFVEADLAGRNLEIPLAQLAEARAIATRARAALSAAQARFDAARQAAEAEARAERFMKVQAVCDKLRTALRADAPAHVAKLAVLVGARRDVVREALAHLEDIRAVRRAGGGLGFVLAEPSVEISAGSGVPAA
jgi:hypothetical protein